MPVDWSSFLGALSARGVKFVDVEQASDHKAVINSVGITDPLDVAILETQWSRHISTSGSAVSVNHPTSASHSRPAAVLPPRGGIPSPPVPGMVAGHCVDPNRLRTEPEDLQDSIIAEELSYALRGISGALIRFDLQTRRPLVAPQLPSSTAHMIQAAMHNATALIALEPICRHEYVGESLIRGAVGEAVREVCAAYVRSIADLMLQHQQQEHRGASGSGASHISLSRLCTEADSRGYAVRRLASLFAAINDPKVTGSLPQAPDGGGLTGPWLLNELHLHYKRALGNPDDERIIGTVLHRAARPYLQILFDWMHRGELHNDPFREFFVIDTDRGSRTAQQQQQAAGSSSASAAAAALHLDDDGASGGVGGGARSGAGARDAIDRWENRFRMLPNQVPAFIAENKVYRTIHTSGRYCHMLREMCGTKTDNGAVDGADSAAAAAPSPSSGGDGGIVDFQAQQQQQQQHNAGRGAGNSGSRMRRGLAGDAATSFTVTFINEDDPITDTNDNDRQQQQQEGGTSRFQWGDARKLEAAVHRASKAASENVLRMLKTKHCLFDRLRSLRYYFFIAHGDWLVNFLDAAQKLLHRPADEVKLYSLNVLLQSSISKSSANDDPCHAYTRCSLSDVSLQQAVALTRRRDPAFNNVYRGGGGGGGTEGSGSSNPTNLSHPCYELLQLEVVSEWPLSLILNEIFVTKLNFVFRLLLRFKLCERALNSLVWHSHQQQHHSQSRNVFGSAAAFPASSFAAGAESEATGYQNAAASLRSQLLQFVRQFQFYAAHEVLEPAWKEFFHKVDNAVGIINIGMASTNLCQTILRGLAITSEHGFQALWSILDLCMAFAQHHHIFMQQHQQQQYHGLAQQQPLHAGALTLESSKQQLAEWQTQLYELLKRLADPNQPDSTNLLQMLVWLDFNGFYEKLGVYKVRHAVRHQRQDDQF